MRKLLALLLLAAPLAAQTINPSTQITWPRVSGTGAPTLTCPTPNNTATTATVGTPYTDISGPHYWQCGTAGWFQVDGAGTALTVKVEDSTSGVNQNTIDFNSTLPAAPGGNQNCTWQNDTATGRKSCYVPIGNFSNFITPPTTGQFAVVYFNSSFITSDPTSASVLHPTGGDPAGTPSNGMEFYNCNGLLCNIAGQFVGGWRNVTLPSYINPANVTAVYVDVVSSGGTQDFPQTPQGPYANSGLNCNGHNLMPGNSGAQPWGMVETTALSGWTGTTVTTASCTMQVGPGGPGASELNVNIPIIRLLIYDSVDTLPVLNYTSLIPPLSYNPVSNSISLDQVNLLSGNSIAWTINKLPTVPGGWFAYFVYDANSPTDCSVGGGTSPYPNAHWCFWDNGTSAWRVGGGGGGSGITALTGDGTATGPGSAALTLATVNSSPGSCGDSTHVCQITTNGKGLTTAQTAVAISGGGGGVTGSGTTGVLPEWTGSTALGDSLLDFGNTTASQFTFAAPVNVNDGTGAAGAVSLKQGTGASNGTTAVTLTAPSSVTSYRVQFPGVHASGSNTYLSCTAADPSVCTWAAGGGGGGGTVSGQASGVIPLGTSATVISNQSHLDDGNTTASTITSTESIAINAPGASQEAFIYNATPIVPGSGTTAVVGSNSSGQLVASESGGSTARVCVAGNSQCQVPITLTTTGSSGPATLSAGTLNIPQYSGGGGSGAWTNITGSVTVSGCAVASGACVVSGSSTTDVSFSSIPSHNRMQIVVWGQASSGTGTGSPYIQDTFNSDSTSGHYVLNGSYQNSTGAPSPNTVTPATVCYVGQLAAGGVSQIVSDLMFYADTTFAKAVSSRYSTMVGTTLADNVDGTLSCGYTQTTAITSVNSHISSGNFVAGTKFMILVQD